MNYKYDVFISYSRKDYVDENKKIIPGNAITDIQNALTKAGFSYWFDKNGIESGQQFAEIIEKAITESMVFLFVSSEASNASVWTMREVFSATDCPDEKHIIPVRLDETPYNSKFRMLLRPYDFINYWDNPEESLQGIVSSIKKRKEEITEKERREQEAKEAKRRQEEEKRKKEEELKAKQKAKADLIQLAEEYHAYKSQEAIHKHKINAKKQMIGITEHICPICQSTVNIGSSFCPTCGWTISPIYGIEGAEYLLSDKNVQIELMKSFCNKPQYSQSISLQKQLEASRKELTSVRKELKQARKELDEERIKRSKLELGVKTKEDSNLNTNNTERISSGNSIQIIREYH